MIIVGTYYTSIISCVDGVFYLQSSGRRLEFHELIKGYGFFAFKEEIHIDDNYTLCQEINRVELDLLENKDDVLIKDVLLYGHEKFIEKIFVFHNEGWKPKFKDLPGDEFQQIEAKINLIFKQFDKDIQLVIDENRDDLQRNYNVLEAFFDLKDEYIQSLEIDCCIDSTREIFELYAKNIIPRYSKLCELGVVRCEADGEFVNDLFYNYLNLYPDIELINCSVWETELADMIYDWYETVEVGFK